MSKVTCIDVSCWQVDVDYNKVKASGIEAVIIRAGYGRETSQKDTQFETHYKNAKNAGLKIGAYWYSYADSVEDAKKEANACLACVKGKTFDMPIYFDMEDNSQVHLGKATLTQMAKVFCETIKAGGYRAGVYANLNWFNNYLDYSELRKLYSIWLAQYYTSNGKECDIWQNSSTGKISGVNGDCDTNIIFNDKVFGSNSPTFSVNKKSNATIADEVMAGKWGNGDDRKKNLTTAGYDYNAIQKIVNDKVNKKSNATIADEVMAGKWGNGDDRKKNLTAAGYDYNAIQKIVNDKVNSKSKTTEQYHTVKSGDTLYDIANKYGTSIGWIVKTNKISNPNLIYPGTKIRVR